MERLSEIQKRRSYSDDGFDVTSSNQKKSRSSGTGIIACRMSGSRCQVPGAQVPGPGCRVSGARSRVSGVECRAPGVGCQGPGSRGPCVRFQGSGAMAK